MQLLAHLRPPQPCRPGKTWREDYQYKRNRTRNRLVCAEPKAGKRQVLVTRRRTQLHFAFAIGYRVDVLYPDARCIDGVLDNLNLHHYHSRVEIFGKQEADRIMSRVCFHFTPHHASWLNLAEIELSVLSQPCLNRRIPDEWTLATEIIAWETDRNHARTPIRWTFTLDDARHVFRDHYPTT